ncbi:MAG: LPS export ABC transporter periplasmic protein LptC [Saprospiraceae bacterium]
MKFFYFFIMLSTIVACSNKVEDIDELLAEGLDAKVEKGYNIRIIYSDSAQIKLVVNAPVMERYVDYSNSKDVFPKGILLEFMGDDQKINSWLKAESAISEARTQKITAKVNVVFYNEKNEKLETPELIFDQKDRIVYTDKLVRITQAEKGDTTYGFGFKANQEFTRFEIVKKVQGKINVSDFVNKF